MAKTVTEQLPAEVVSLLAESCCRVFLEHPIEDVTFTGPAASDFINALLGDMPDGWAKVNGSWVQIAAMHTLWEGIDNGVPTGYYARLDTEQYEATR